jgi:hypothetical protein
LVRTREARNPKGWSTVETNYSTNKEVRSGIRGVE